jgi:uncharacterized protein (TIGR02996 family)
MTIDALAALERTQRALESSDGVTALTELLDAWRALRAPDIASSIDALSAKLDEPRARIPEDAAFHAAWIDVAREGTAADVPRLLPGLLCPPLGDRLIERVREMTMRPDDPRIAAGLVAMCEEPPATSQSIIGKLWGPIFTALERIGDARSREGLAKRLRRKGGRAHFWAQHYRRIAKLLEKLPAPPAVDSDTKRRLADVDKLVRRLTVRASVTATKKPPGGDDALQIVYDDPSSIAARLVCADRLSERGDPRGELIMLQSRLLEGSGTAADAKKERELLKVYGDHFVPPQVLPVLTPKQYGFHLGFVDDAEVIFGSHAQQKTLAPHPAWRTLRTLYCDDVAFITNPNLVSLDKIGSFTVRTLLAIAKARALPVTRVGTLLLDSCPPSALEELRALDPSALPKLREVELCQYWRFADDRNTQDYRQFKTWTAFAWLGSVPLFQQLPVLKLDVDADASFLDAFDVLPKLERLEVVGGPALYEVTRRDGAMSGVVRIHTSSIAKYPKWMENFAKQVRLLALALKKRGVEHLCLADALSNPTRKTLDALAAMAKLPVDASQNRATPNLFEIRTREKKRIQRFRAASAKRT